ncbi:MAG TPA: hypothetical protein VHE33_09270, partial [Acidobacteriaceae bacterium]|nr:hypothetical protein [Acidobacteriaceae bacterium]
DQEKALALPVIRRALRSLQPTLRRCGLRAIAQYRQGYVLAPLLPSEDQHIDHTKGRGGYGSRT